MYGCCHYGRRSSLSIPEGYFLRPSLRGVMRMQVTYSDLFQFCLVVIGIIGLFIQAKNKK